MNERKPYLSDLNDREWALLEPLTPAKRGGRPGMVSMREVLNTIFYVVETGCQWSQLPRDFPPKGTVYHYFNTWRKDGTWARLKDALREQLRHCTGHQVTPSAGSIFVKEY